MSSFEAIERDIKYLTKTQDEFQEQLNDQKTHYEATKKGIYNYIDKNIKEIKTDMVKELTELKETMNNDIIKPYKDDRKMVFKIAIAGIGLIFTGMAAFIIWILNVTSAMGNIEKLLGG